MKNKILTIALSILVIVAGVFAVLGAKNTQQALGAVTNQAYAYLATSTSITVGTTTSVQAFSSRVMCASRIISTKANAIMVGFGTTSTATNGFWQAASTTQVYPSNQFGCGAVNIYGLVSSTTINIAEFLY